MGSNIAVPFAIRSLLKSKGTIELVISLRNEFLQEKEKYFIYLPELDHRINSYLIDASDTKIPDVCFESNDCILITELGNQKIIDIDCFCPDDNGSWGVIATRRDMEAISSISTLGQSIKDKETISYGIFSLNLSDGSIFVGDEKTFLQPNSKKFKIYKRLLESSDHTVSYKEIKALMGREDYQKGENYIYEVINDLKDVLKLKNDLANLLKATSDQKYKLTPGD